MAERRTGSRHALSLEVELHNRQDRIPVRAVDVSRHGLFLACADPPQEHHAVLLTVKLPGGPFETMATVARRNVDKRAGVVGAGVKLFCLGSDAKMRWDKFVLSLDNKELVLPTRARGDTAVFLVQLDDPALLLSFYTQRVLGQKTTYVSPAVHKVGAEVSVVLVHPVTHDELALAAHVVEWNPDRPLRMGLRFDLLDRVARRAFLDFLGPVPGVGAVAPPPEPALPTLVAAERPHWTEYAFYSPKLRRETEVTDPGRAKARTTTTRSAEEILLLDVEAEDAPLVVLSKDDLDVIEGELMELPELDMVDKGALFDFDWKNEESE